MKLLFCFLALLAMAILLPVKSGVVRSRWTGAAVVLLGILAMVVRILLLDWKTGDYNDFLQPWVEFFRANGGFAALRQSVGNYNIPYLYFLAAFSYLDVEPLYPIKLLSIAFDILLAWSAMRLYLCVGKSETAALGTYYTVLFLPTVVLNGAMWGQCDSVFVALGVLSFALALEGKPVRAMIAITLSFAFKLQAVFLMPVFLLFWIAGRVKWYHFSVFPVTYVLVILPAVLLGRPFMDTLTLYWNQAGSVGSGANYNSSSVFSFFQNPGAELMNAGILAAFLLVICVALLFLLKQKNGDNLSLLAAAAIFAVGIPFFLPHMHDRYFYAADVLTVVFAFASFRHFPIPVFVSFGSLLGYHAYLRGRYLVPMAWGGIAMGGALIWLLCFFLRRLFRDGKKAEISS